MVPSLAAALKIFEKTLREHKELIDAIFPDDCTELYLQRDGETYQTLARSFVSIQGMIQVLRLNKRDLKKIFGELGISGVSMPNTMITTKDSGRL